MDINTKIKDFINYAKEICLQNLFLADNIKVDLKNQDNLYEVERIEKEVISVYENIYLSLDEEFLLNLYKENKKAFEQLEETIEKMKKDANLKDEYIKTQIKKRIELKGNSGAEVVEKFFKYKIKELKKIKGDLLQKLNKLLDKEEKLNLDLSNAIQEVEQLEIIEKIQPVRAEFRNLSLQLDKYQKELEETENKLLKKWYYEIYSTTEGKMSLQAIIKTNKGEINLNLFSDVAPVTVLNFITLAKTGYYNGLKFHRVIEDFMIQGGDPTGTGAGGPGYQFGDEFKEGVVFNKKGLLAMANAGPNTNGSQFFITHAPTEWLNYKHTIFGEVVSQKDQDVVDSIKQNDTMNEVIIVGNTDRLIEDNKEFYTQLKNFLKI